VHVFYSQQVAQLAADFFPLRGGDYCLNTINEATQTTLDQFRKKASEIPFDAHPYAMALEGRKKLGIREWTEEHRNDATSAMVLWVTMIVGNSMANTLNEILALMRIAAETEDPEHRKAVDDMSSSMTFIENVFKVFMTSIDFQHVAEQLFADGEKMEKERNEEFAAAEAAKAKVTKTKADAPQPLSGTVHRRWEPSQN
jgi:hypothetical protein